MLQKTAENFLVETKVMSGLQLRIDDYDTTTTHRARLLPLDASVSTFSS